MIFKPIDKNLALIKEFINMPHANFCDISLGVKYLWRKEFSCDFCVVDNTLIIKESCRDYKNAFYFPIGLEVQKGLDAIEQYCQKTNIPLIFCCVDNVQAGLLCQRYPLAKVYNDRDWSDYIYLSEEFRNFTGKKFSGQRNHINKFKKLYPNCTFEKVTKDNLHKVVAFIKEQTATSDYSVWTKNAEAQMLCDYTQNMFDLCQVGGMVLDGEKVVGATFGEVVLDTLIVHVEKADRSYQGIYPFLANNFAKAFGQGVKFINREEDCGDMGLRISKLQYQPIEIKEKNIVSVQTLFDGVNNIEQIQTERLEITPIVESDKNDYYNLYTDKELNKYWGYDYLEDLPQNPTPNDFFNFMLSLKQKGEEVSFAVRLNGKMIGELVVYNFGYYADCEIGYRFFKQCQGKGYALESAKSLIEYIQTKLGGKKFKTRCFKQNLPSKKLAIKLGYSEVREDATHFYFERVVNG